MVKTTETENTEKLEKMKKQEEDKKRMMDKIQENLKKQMSNQISDLQNEIKKLKHRDEKDIDDFIMWKYKKNKFKNI